MKKSQKNEGSLPAAENSQALNREDMNQTESPQPPYTPQQPVWGYPAGDAGPYYVPYPYGAAPPVKPERPKRLKDASKTVNRLSLIVILQSVISLVIQIAVMIWLDISGKQMQDMGILLLSAALSPIATAFPCLIYLFIHHSEAGDYIRAEKEGVFVSVLWVLAGVGICLLGDYPAFFVQNLLEPLGYHPSENIVAVNSWSHFFVELVTSALLVPLMEEFAFRGVIFSALRKHGTTFAIITSALIFAMAHLEVSSVVFAFVAGLALGFVYSRTHNLWVTAFIHGINNAIAVVTSYSNFLFGRNADNVSSYIIFAFLVLGAVSLVILLIADRKKIFHVEPPQPWEEYPLSFGEGASCVVRAPLFWALFGMVICFSLTMFF